jgi:ABC-type transporter Mla MlaB component
MCPDENHCATVAFSGEMTVRTINDAYRRLCEELQNNNAIVIDAGEVSDVDLSFVQLLESARRTAAHEGKHCALASPASGGLRTMLERGGFFNQPGSETRGFWLQESGDN